MPFDADVIIVGAGPAGMSAALVLGRACRTVLMFDDGKPRNAATQAMHGFLTRDGVVPERVPAHFARAAHALRQRPARVGHGLVGVVSKDGGFTVTLDGGRTCSSRKLLLATGVVDNVPDLPGLTELYGRSIFHCPFCDGWEVRGPDARRLRPRKRGFGLSMELLGWSKDVVSARTVRRARRRRSRDARAQRHSPA